VGHNHQGNLDTAMKLIHAAKLAGANAVKFQKRNNKTLFTKRGFEAPYHNENSYGDTYGNHREALEFGKREYEVCANEAKTLGIDFFATAFDFSSADFLMELDVPAFKIASGDLKTIQLIEYVASFGKPIIISTGGGELSDIRRAVTIAHNLNPNVAVLQCTAGYPPEFNELNLRVIETLRKEFPNITVGYSGHDSGIAMALVAYVLGARVIEKHFTLNRAMKGTDHSFSLEPQGMSKLSRDLQRTNLALGDGIKRKYDSETVPLKKMGKSIYFARSIPKGTTIEKNDLAFKSPAEGLPPSEIEQILGRKLQRSVSEDDLVTLDDLV
jgi:N-acetylneuraminate synthase/sialic acid synthase